MTTQIITLGLQIVPLGTAGAETYHVIDQAIDQIKSSGLRYRVTPFETVIEGSYEEAMHAVAEAQKIALNAADELLVYYRIHMSKDRDITFEEKNLDR